MFEICASNDPWVGEGLAAGAHVVTMQATLPGTSQVVMSSSLQVTLTCDEAGPEAQAGGGCSTAGSGAAPWVALALLALVHRRSRHSARPRRSQSMVW